MTQVNSAQRSGKKVASTPRARVRTVAAHRADWEQQVRLYLASDTAMALTEPAHVRERMKELRKRAGNPSQYEVAHDLSVPPRTFQSWENAEVETDKANYEKVARYYTRKLKQRVTANWILFGQDEAPALPTPDLMGQVNNGPTLAEIKAQLDRIEHKLDHILSVFGLDEEDADLSAAVDAVARALEERGEGGEAAA